jgi:hypothetical protein
VGHTRRARIALAILAVLLLATASCREDSGEQEITQRVILVQGACSSTANLSDASHWTANIKRQLAAIYGFTDAPTGSPDDQVIEFGYSPGGWDAAYAPQDTLRPLAASSAALMAIYNAYPNSKFFIIGHSLGGVVALDALARDISAFGDMAERTLGVATVGSPVAGLSEQASEIAAFTIELLACRDISGIGESGQVWDDLQAESAGMSLIRGATWNGLKVINFANTRDRVTDWQIAFLTPPFKSHCFDLSGGFLDLNHDSILNEAAPSQAMLSVLLGSAPLNQPCAG